MNRKAQGSAFWTPKSVKAAIIFMVLAIIGSMALYLIILQLQSDNLVASQDAKTFLLYENMRHCFLYEQNGRVYYDTIDLSLITKDKISECLPEKSVKIEVRKGTQTIKEEYVNEATGYSNSKSFPINVKDTVGVHYLVVSLA